MSDRIYAIPEVTPTDGNPLVFFVTTISDVYSAQVRAYGQTLDVGEVQSAQPQRPSARKYSDALGISKTKRREVAWYQTAKQSLDHLSGLPLDWDTYGAEPPNPKAIYYAGEAICVLQEMNFPAPRIVASVENGVGITYRRGAKSATIEFFNTGEIVAVRSDGQALPHAWEVDASREGIQSALEDIREFLYG